MLTEEDLSVLWAGRRRTCLPLLVGVLLAGPLSGQTRADSAAITLLAARTLEREGQSEAARRVFELVRDRYRGTPAALTADSLLRVLGPSEGPTRATGRTGFILFHTVYGGFLGAAIPAALGATGSELYGAGMLVGGPASFFWARSFASTKITMPGQAAIGSFATLWGTWQGLALQQVLDLGDRDVCPTGPGGGAPCYVDESDTAPWAAMVLGGVVGLGTGTVLAQREIASGSASLVSHSALWGSWFGLSAAGMLGGEGDDLIAGALIGGDLLLIAAIPAARAWRPQSSRVRLATAAGIAGGLVGVGIDLLGSIDHTETSYIAPALGSALGLVLGARLGRRQPADFDRDGAGLALLTVRPRQEPRLGIPVPLPSAIPDDSRSGRRLRPGARLLLLDAVF